MIQLTQKERTLLEDQKNTNRSVLKSTPITLIKPNPLNLSSYSSHMRPRSKTTIIPSIRSLMGRFLMSTKASNRRAASSRVRPKQLSQPPICREPWLIRVMPAS